MFKTMIASLTALSLSFAPAPASALTDEEVARLLLGLVAVGVVGKIISNNNNTDRQATPAHQSPRSERHTGRPERSHNEWREPAALPRDCLRIIDTHRGPQRIFGGRCLNQTYRDANSLPQQCAIRTRGHNGRRGGYDPSCLRDHGFRIGRN